MIYSTILPEDIVWQGFEELENKQYMELTNGHMRLVVDPISTTQAKIIRLISPDPFDYLKPSLAPGSIIPFALTWLD